MIKLFISIFLLILTLSQNNFNKLSNTCEKVILKDSIVPVYGSPILNTLLYPKIWKPDPKNYGLLLGNDEIEFNALKRQYEQYINSKKDSLKRIQDIIPIDLSDDSCWYPLLFEIDSVNFQIQDIGNYRCYFTSYNNYINQDFRKLCTGKYISIGTIIFIHKVTYKAKILIVNKEEHAEMGVSFRYFSIDKNGTIKTYAGACYDSGCSLSKEYEIKINKSDEFIIENL